MDKVKWYKEGVEEPVGEGPTLFFGNVTLDQCGIYQAQVIDDLYEQAGNADASTWSRKVALRVVPQKRRSGMLDTSFYPDLVSGSSQTVRAIEIDETGAVYLGGRFESIDPEITGLALLKLQEDGSPDPAFQVSFSLSGEESPKVLAVAAIGDEIVVGGEFDFCQGQQCGNVVRLNAVGEVVSNYSGGAGGVVNAVAADAAGRVLIGGDFENFGGGTHSWLVRLNEDGVVDSSFSGHELDGEVNVIEFENEGLASSRIVVGGEFRNRVSWLTEDGGPDSVFLSKMRGQEYVFDLAVLPDGSVVAAIDSGPGLTKLRRSGEIDGNFIPMLNDEVFSLEVDQSGKILVGGLFTGPVGKAAPFLARVNSNGTYDASFIPPITSDKVRVVERDGAMLYVGGDFNFPRIGSMRLLTTPPGLSGGDPEIHCQPLSQEVVLGHHFVLTVGVEFPEHYRFQWYKDNELLDEETSSRLERDSFSGADVGRYFVTVTNTTSGLTSWSTSAIVTAVERPFWEPEQRRFTLNERQELNPYIRSVSLALPAMDIQSVKVGVDISYPRVKKLKATLKAPGGKRVVLFDEPGPKDSDGRRIAAVFDDLAIDKLDEGASPWGGTWRPEESLGSLGGDVPAGEWKIEVEFPVGRETIAVENAFLEIELKPEAVTWDNWQAHFPGSTVPEFALYREDGLAELEIIEAGPGVCVFEHLRWADSVGVDYRYSRVDEEGLDEEVDVEENLPWGDDVPLKEVVPTVLSVTALGFDREIVTFSLPDAGDSEVIQVWVELPEGQGE